MNHMRISGIVPSSAIHDPNSMYKSLEFVAKITT